MNDESRGTYNTNSQIKFKTSMLRSILFHYNDAHIAAKGILRAPNTGTAASQNNKFI